MGKRREFKEKLNQIVINSKREMYRYALRDTLKKHGKCLYLNFADFDKALESIDYLQCYGLSEIRRSSEKSNFPQEFQLHLESDHRSQSGPPTVIFAFSSGIRLGD